MKRLVALVIAIGAVSVLSGCAGSASSSQDITKLLAVTEVKTGWFDAGLENGMNKLVPSLTITLKNVSNSNVALVQLNAVIRRVGETEEWGGAYTKAIGSPGLAPGQSTPPIVLRSNLGYTGIEPRNVMFKNSQFVDAKIQLFAKYGGGGWVKLGEYPVTRDLLTQ
ncbi:MAG TPA: hypothetical protein VL243_07565 [Vicinamibacterales bacterium]|nr:hypothetical protein [Vicinamibacterales bacterium]